MNAVIESCLRAVTSSDVLANTVYQSACATPDIQHFVPLRTHVVTVADRLGAHAHHVAAGLRLGEAERRPLRSRRRSA